MPHPGLFSGDTVKHTWMLPVRLLFAWPWRHARGTIAGATDYYPFGTRMTAPGWGDGIVTHRGSAIKGPDRLDLLFRWGWQAEGWGRKKVEVEIEDE